MTTNELTIQELVDLSGVSRRNIYFYTQQGILPPPSGAGLSARYKSIHLLRLRAIPTLKENGLRLDEIRQSLAAMDESAIEKLLARETHPRDVPAPPPSPEAAAPKESIVHPSNQGQAFFHYALPHGIVLVVPSNLDENVRREVERLLASGERILNGGQPGGPDRKRNLC